MPFPRLLDNALLTIRIFTSTTLAWVSRSFLGFFCRHTYFAKAINLLLNFGNICVTFSAYRTITFNRFDMAKLKNQFSNSFLLSSFPAKVDGSIIGRGKFNRHLKIAVYGKRLTSDTLFAVKTKPLTVKCFTYTIYSNDRKRRTETLCLTTVT